MDEIEAAIGEIRALNEQETLIDQIVVVAANSRDDLAVAYPDVEVYVRDELMPGYGPVASKGDAM